MTALHLDNAPIWTTQPQPVIKTERLQLRPFAMKDADVLEPLVSRREIAATTLSIPHPYPKGGAAEWLSRREEDYRTGRAINCAITLRGAGELIGAISLHFKGPLVPDVAEIGYWIAYEHWQKGYGTEAVGAIINLGFEFAKVHRIEAHHFSNNPASGKLMQKNGMKYEGCMRERVLKWGERLDAVLYAILREDWEAARTK